MIRDLLYRFAPGQPPVDVHTNAKGLLGWFTPEHIGGLIALFLVVVFIRVFWKMITGHPVIFAIPGDLRPDRRGRPDLLPHPVQRRAPVRAAAMTLATKVGIGVGLGVMGLGAMIGSNMRKHGAEVRYGSVVVTSGLFAGLLVWFLLTVPASGWDW
jgi:hypothetical protein